MPNAEIKATLLTGWDLKVSLWDYVLLCMAITIAVRIIGSLLKAFEPQKEHSTLKYFSKVFYIFRGFNKKYMVLSDHWLGAFIGFTEVSVFPILIFTDNLVAIGGWLGLKTVIGFHAWTEKQRAYNRFLVQNILNLAASYIICLPYFIKVG